jgi:hypothetical protein
MSMSLDGYIAGPNDGPNKPGREGFSRLHDWLGDPSQSPEAAKELLHEMNARGAVLAGRRTVEQVGHYQAMSPSKCSNWRPPARARRALAYQQEQAAKRMENPLADRQRRQACCGACEEARGG